MGQETNIELELWWSILTENGPEAEVHFINIAPLNRTQIGSQAVSSRKPRMVCKSWTAPSLRSVPSP